MTIQEGLHHFEWMTCKGFMEESNPNLLQKQIDRSSNYKWNENTNHPDLKDATKAVFQGKFIAYNAYVRKEGRSTGKFNNLSFYIRKLEKE